MSDSIYVSNRRAWRAYNKSHIIKAHQYSQRHGQLAFHVIPLLLHVNQPDLPGFIQDADITWGIIRSSPMMKQGPAPGVIPGLDFTKINIAPRHFNCLIESVLLMGSVGTVAQNKYSDYDYWIIVDETKIEQGALAALKQK